MVLSPYIPSDGLQLPSGTAPRPVSYLCLNDEACIIECLPDHDEERAFVIGSCGPLRVRELRYSEGGLGGGVWPCSLAMAHWLASTGVAADDTRVLELGAGVGLPGLVAAWTGARVTSTEMEGRPALIENLQHNFAINELPGEARALDWSSPSSWFFEPFDLVLCSDLIYYEELLAPLANTLEHHVAPGGSATLVCPEERADTSRQAKMRPADLLALLPDGDVHEEAWTLRRSREDVLRLKFIRWHRKS